LIALSEFFDRNGNAIAYIPDGENLYTWQGKPVAFLRGDRIFNYRGKLIGWFQDGWFRDRQSKCMLFTPEAQGGPVKPVRKVKPVKSVRSVRPVKPVTEVPPVQPVKTLSWSSQTLDQLV
jgi:hypothetical protein